MLFFAFILSTLVNYMSPLNGLKIRSCTAGCFLRFLRLIFRFQHEYNPTFWSG
jgi:hypothetical protein